MAGPRIEKCRPSLAHQSPSIASAHAGAAKEGRDVIATREIAMRAVLAIFASPLDLVEKLSPPRTHKINPEDIEHATKAGPACRACSQRPHRYAQAISPASPTL